MESLILVSWLALYPEGDCHPVTIKVGFFFIICYHYIVNILGSKFDIYMLKMDGFKRISGTIEPEGLVA